MSEIPDAGRRSAHVFLDAVSAWADDASDQTNEEVVQLAIERLNDISAVRASLGDDDVLDLDISDLVGGVLVTMSYLIRQLSVCAELDKQEAIAKTREFIDRL